jgi:hypothetical protein
MASLSLALVRQARLGVRSLDAWGSAFGPAWGAAFGAEAPVVVEAPPASVPIYVATGGAGWNRAGWSHSANRRHDPIPIVAESLHNDEEENEMATIAAFVIGNLA